VIITACNCAPVLERTLRSVDASATYLRTGPAAAPNVPVEAVVVDDGSTDATPRIVESFTGGRSAWRLVRRDKPTSPSCARNAGVAAAQGTLLFFLDGDDLFLPEHLAACYKLLSDPAVDFVKTGVRLADPVHADWRPRIENSI